MKGSQNPLVSDFYTQRRGTIFSMFEARWRARDSRAVIEIARRFRASEYHIDFVHAHARNRGTWDIRELRDKYEEFVGDRPLLEDLGGRDSGEFLAFIEKRRDPHEALEVPVKGPVIVVGRPESFYAYDKGRSEFRRLIDATGYPQHRFQFASSDFLAPTVPPSDNPLYRHIIDRRNGMVHEHVQTPETITDFALIYCARVPDFYTHNRLVTIVAGTGTVGTLGATKLIMDHGELLRRCPELGRGFAANPRWPIEILLHVESSAGGGRPHEQIWDVSLKDVRMPVPVSVGCVKYGGRESPWSILSDFQDKPASEAEPIDLIEYWHPPDLPLSERLVGKPEGRFVTEVLKQIRDAACDLHPVLILGESGVGKEVVARLLFLYNVLWRRITPQGAAATGPRLELQKRILKEVWSEYKAIEEPIFQAVNCGAVDPSLMNSQLFGHCKGGYTDASSDRAGAFLAAGVGTVFLDELHTLDLHHQAALLRAIQEREVSPVGIDTPIPYCCRVVAASNEAEIKSLADQGKFRGDLLNRFRHVIQIPPLNERLEDAVAYAVQCRHARKNDGKAGPALIEMGEAEIRRLLAQDYARKNFRLVASLTSGVSTSNHESWRGPEDQRVFHFKAEFPGGADSFRGRDLNAIASRLKGPAEGVPCLDDGTVKRVFDWLWACIYPSKTSKESSQPAGPPKGKTQRGKSTTPQAEDFDRNLARWFLREVAREHQWASQRGTLEGLAATLPRHSDTLASWQALLLLLKDFFEPHETSELFGGAAETAIQAIGGARLEPPHEPARKTGPKANL